MLSEDQKSDLKLIDNSLNVTDTKYKPLWKKWEQLYESEHDKEYVKKRKKQDRNHIFIPLTYSTISIADSVFTTSFFGNGNPIEVLKVGDKDANKRSALKTVVDHLYKKAKAHHELSLAFLSGSLFGIGAVKIYWNDTKKIPDTDMLLATSLGFDIDAISRKDNKYVVHRFMQTNQDIQQRFKTKFYKADAETRSKFMNTSEDEKYKRREVKEIYSELPNGKFRVRTFCDDACLRTETFKTNPIKHGYLIPKLPSVCDEKRKNQVAAIGESMVRIIAPLNEELNTKRNQRMDLIEKHLNPDIYIPVGCGVNPEDAEKMGGIKSCDSTNGIKEMTSIGASEFLNDIQMLKSDVEDASSINGIMRGSTNASDRRSSTALATVSANSSTRLESMIQLICETLFEDWARDFVRLCYINVDDALVDELTEGQYGKYPLGVKGARPELDIDIEVNFGTSINKQAKIQDLLSIIQMVANRQDADINAVMEEAIKLILGDNANAKRILGLSSKSAHENPLGENADTQTEQAGVNSTGREAEENNEPPSGNLGNQSGGELSQIRNNEI
jgi:hypothetical protein